MVEGECGSTERRYGQGGEVNSKGNLGGPLKFYLQRKSFQTFLHTNILHVFPTKIIILK